MAVGQKVQAIAREGLLFFSAAAEASYSKGARRDSSFYKQWSCLAFWKETKSFLDMRLGHGRQESMWGILRVPSFCGPKGEPNGTPPSSGSPFSDASPRSEQAIS